MPLIFVTSSTSKLAELSSIVPNVEHLEMDLPEIQHIDPKVVIESKIKEALKSRKGEFIVEDTSLYFDSLNGLPGPLIKWFMKALGNEGLATMVRKLDNSKAVAKTLIGYGKSATEIEYFEGAVEGMIVEPRGAQGFGWDAIFLPDGHDKTFAEMSQEEKNSLSMRKVAAIKLRNFLAEQ
ncbi:MAG: non-canonical purine NTP pyrophosphatase [Candidatus Berkelbacteria bacterium]|nr:non-canonical purine NTP pyrophosphatase [Candidatus Berkelbacteria bacterium]